MTDTSYECGFLTNGIPQGHDAEGKPIWYCKCRKFRTTDFEELKDHIEGDDEYSTIFRIDRF
jgi:hypothetical protein